MIEWRQRHTIFMWIWCWRICQCRWFRVLSLCCEVFDYVSVCLFLIAARYTTNLTTPHMHLFNSNKQTDIFLSWNQIIIMLIGFLWFVNIINVILFIYMNSSYVLFWRIEKSIKMPSNSFSLSCHYKISNVYNKSFSFYSNDNAS